MKICRVRKCNVERPVLPYFSSKLFELQVPFLNFLNLFGVLDPCDCGFPKLGPKTSMIFADTREFTRSRKNLVMFKHMGTYLDRNFTGASSSSCSMNMDTSIDCLLNNPQATTPAP